MDLYDVMRTTFAAREFTGEPLLDPTLYRILDNARFAPSGGNRQGTDQDLDRVGVVSGASVYPLVWNILLAARGEGYGGNLSTMVVPQEPEVQKLLGEFPISARSPRDRSRQAAATTDPAAPQHGR